MGCGNNEVRFIISNNVQTGKSITDNAENRVFQSLRKAIYKPKILNKVGDEISLSFSKELAKYTGKKVTLGAEIYNEIKNAIASGVVKAQSYLMSKDDLGDQLAGRTIQATRGVYSAFKLAQSATENATPIVGKIATGTIKVATGTSKGIWNIASTVRVAGLTVSRTATMSHMLQFAPISKDTLNILKFQAVDTGLINKSIVKPIVKVGKGILEVATTSARVRLTIGSTVKIVNNMQFSMLSRDTINILKNQAISTGLVNTAIAKIIAHRVELIKNKAVEIKTKIDNAKKTIKRAKVIVKVIKRGVVRGTITIKIPHELLKQARMRVLLGVKKGVVVGSKLLARGSIRAVAKTSVFAMKKGIPFAKKEISNSVTKISDLLIKADNYAINGVGYAIKIQKAMVKTEVLAFKTTKATVKTSVKVGKNIYKAGKASWAFASYIKNKGLKAAWDRARAAAIKKTVQAGKSVVTALVNLVKVLGRKIIIPIILICILIVIINDVITTPTIAISSLFSGSFGTSEGNEYEISQYLNDPNNGIPSLREAYINDLASEMQSSLSTYNIVRFYANTAGSSEVSPTAEGIRSIFPTSEQISSIIQPIFNAVILMDYDLEPTENEAKQLVEELFNTLFIVQKEATTEMCGQDLLTGEGTSVTHGCGSVHAYLNCPNKVESNHTSYTCSDCCDYTCPGHQYTCVEENCPGHTNYCSGCEFICNGYSNCGGHSVLTYKLNIDGVYKLLDKYFTQPIDQLANITGRTQEEEVKLQNLKDYYEICLEYISQSTVYIGGGMTMEDLSGVEFINGSRNQGQTVVDLALTQVGQSGGEPYWRFLGFSSRVAWCACFVNWVMRNSPQGNSYPTTSNNAYCPTLATWFQENGRWGNRDFLDLVAGDAIFFDWENDGITDHIGIVIGRDATTIYTVEGNSGDAVRLNSYPIGSLKIYGYGLMNY